MAVPLGATSLHARLRLLYEVFGKDNDAAHRRQVVGSVAQPESLVRYFHWRQVRVILFSEVSSPESYVATTL